MVVISLHAARDVAEAENARAARSTAPGQYLPNSGNLASEPLAILREQNVNMEKNYDGFEITNLINATIVHDETALLSSTIFGTNR